MVFNGILYISLVMLVHLKKGCEKSHGDDTSALKLKLQLKNVSQIIYRGCILLIMLSPLLVHSYSNLYITNIFYGR